ncbi:hypothetical protein LWI29_009850 [Acer saccharum]|uniref:PGG domain-containing protein n=1 Tax=Acer saccharum TaxID=4024 RepID=A0AA39RRK6_ACESA|nr:hypothetical protein LWI29_009850 [Acer saccharum]
MPSHYGLVKDDIHKKTPEQFFKETHEKQLGDARDYIKMTAQACSTVAVLIATVVYAAAYTLPGGNNQHGRPMFKNSSAFALFTVTDYIAVGCSLTSVVMFLSILVAPLQLRDFHHTLPRTPSRWVHLPRLVGGGDHDCVYFNGFSHHSLYGATEVVQDFLLQFGLGYCRLLFKRLLLVVNCYMKCNVFRGSHWI